MNHTLNYLILVCTCLCLTLTLFSQTWEKRTVADSDSVFAIYSWKTGNQYHSAYGEIILSKSGNFNYISEAALDFKEYSSGTFSIEGDKLFLTSYLQHENIKIDISYIDSIIVDTLYKRLNFPINNKGETIKSGYYFLNNDTTINGWFDPGYPLNRHFLDSVTSLKVRFNETDFGSSWIPITRSNRFIKVKILTNQNFDDYKPKIFSNWAFQIVGSRLVEVHKGK